MTDGGKRSLLLIHGSNFKPAADVYLDIAMDAIRAGLERDYPDCVECFDNMSRDLAWYGDLNAAVLEAAGRNYDEPLDVGDRRNAMQAMKQCGVRRQVGD